MQGPLKHIFNVVNGFSNAFKFVIRSLKVFFKKRSPHNSFFKDFDTQIIRYTKYLLKRSGTVRILPTYLYLERVYRDPIVSGGKVCFCDKRESL